MPPSDKLWKTIIKHFCFLLSLIVSPELKYSRLNGPQFVSWDFLTSQNRIMHQSKRKSREKIDSGVSPILDAALNECTISSTCTDFAIQNYNFWLILGATFIPLVAAHFKLGIIFVATFWRDGGQPFYPILSDPNFSLSNFRVCPIAFFPCNDLWTNSFLSSVTNNRIGAEILPNNRKEPLMPKPGRTDPRIAENTYPAGSTELVHLNFRCRSTNIS